MLSNIVGVRLSGGGRIYNFDPAGLNLAVGQKVVVQTEQGLALGVVRQVNTPSLLSQHPNPDFQLESLPDPQSTPDNSEADETEIAEALLAPEQDDDAGQAAIEQVNDAPVLKKILRLASYDDLQQLERNQDLEKKAMLFCRQKIEELKLNMTPVKAECLFDRSKVVIYFTSEERLDFRELVHDLAAHLRVRVELRQIGVRQETKMLGGLGGCGRELCCAHVLREFAQVGVKMAKEQSLSLNPTKISGLCGRLMCCLGYEFETYRALCKEMPKVGKKVKISPELEGKVLRHSPLTGQLTLALSDGRTVTCTLQEMAALEPVENNRRSQRVPTARPAVVKEAEAAVAGDKEVKANTSDEQEQTEGDDKPKRRSRRSRGRRKGKKPKTGTQGSEE